MREGENGVGKAAHRDHRAWACGRENGVGKQLTEITERGHADVKISDVSAGLARSIAQRSISVAFLLTRTSVKKVCPTRVSTSSSQICRKLVNYCFNTENFIGSEILLIGEMFGIRQKYEILSTVPLRCA